MITTKRAEGQGGGALVLRRMVLALLAAVLMTAMTLGEAGSAQAKEAAHCIGDQVSFSECAGGSGQRGGGGGGKVLTTVGGSTSIGGGSDFRGFRGTGSGGGGRNCSVILGTPEPCESGKDAQR